ncbi:site-specific DNA-methyltransferase [Candidatus Peregrinibacteria bacterium]|nr:MAG: site-specific DNA-methyltransferase [Candidatus Peregrinibacteria bacterium]
MKNTLFALLQSVLKKDDRFFAEDRFLKNQVIEYAHKYDEHLIKLLLSNEEIKGFFFKEIEKALIFNKDLFVKFVSNKEFLPDSYTSFRNKVGLACDEESYIKEVKDVSLVFPFKDCVLEGGQTKEDQSRQEVFHNHILSPDEISVLLKPKVLTKFKKWDKDGAHEDFEITEKDNWIIKGNNLLVLHSLKERFVGKVKLIYIDPPYNTGNDSFKYNDRFNHASWLVFMKNRLEVAKELLREDGSIFISIDDSEFAYLKILCDEIFGQENFLADIIWNSTKSVTNTAIISESHNHTLVFFKKKEYFVKNRTEFRLSEDGEGFSNPDNDPRGPWKADPFQVGGWRPNQQYEVKNPNTGEIYKPNEGCSWKNDFQKFQELEKDGRIVFGTTGEAGPQRKRFLSEALERGKVSKTIWDDVGTTTEGTGELKKLGLGGLFTSPKPEKLLQRIIELSTKENDLVLDFFSGSGTTLAVAHKMGRQYIGVEQMDYIKDLPEARLRKVIEGEQGGISKAVNWQGGGSFIYAELFEWNAEYARKIQETKNSKELLKLWEEMKEKRLSFLSGYLEVKKFNENMKHFEEFSLEEQKALLMESLNHNFLYIPISEIEDSEYQISEEDKKKNSQFYQK